MLSRAGGGEVELDLGRVGQGRSLDGDEAVLVGVAHHKPPLLLLRLRRRMKTRGGDWRELRDLESIKVMQSGARNGT